MSASVAPASALPWWKEPTKDQWYAYSAAWMGWTLDAFDFTVFLLIMTVKGVGPKLGLGILSQMPPATLIQALLKRDLAALTRLPGVGKKMAERLAVELSDKAKTWALSEGVALGGAQIPGQFENSESDQAVSALQALGIPSQQAKLAVERAYQRLGNGDVKIEDIVRSALKFI